MTIDDDALCALDSACIGADAWGLLEHRMLIRLLIRNERQRGARAFVLRAKDDAFEVGVEGGAVHLVGGRPALVAMHQAIATPRAPVPLGQVPLTTARDAVQRAIDRLDAACPGVRAALEPRRAKDGGLTVRAGAAGAELVFAPRPGRAIRGL